MKKLLLPVTVASLMLASFNPLNAASFDCRKASTDIEHLICEDSELNRLDTEMGRLYNEAKHLPGMKDEQKRWVHHRNKLCGSSDGCLIGETQDRIAALKNALAHQNSSNGGSTHHTKKGVFSPTQGIICDAKSGFCVDSYGISLGYTGSYLGKKNQDIWAKKLSGDYITTEFSFSNRVYCNTKQRICKKEKYADKPDRYWTNILFGR